MEHLDVLPTLSDLSGTRKCYLGPKILDAVSVKLGDCVKIKTDCCSYVCTAWPRRDNAEGYIQFDFTVVCRSGQQSTYCGKCLTQNNNVLQNHIPSREVRKLEHGKLNSVNVNVILDDYRDVSIYRKSASSDAFSRKVFSVLRKMFLSKGAVVRSHRLKLGKLNKISYIVVINIECNAECGLVTADTKIAVDGISSKDRFEQNFKSNSKMKLGGLSRERSTLVDTVSLPFKYPDARDKYGIQFTRGILLRGPMGCGKTCLVRSIYFSFIS